MRTVVYLITLLTGSEPSTSEDPVAVVEPAARSHVVVGLVGETGLVPTSVEATLDGYMLDMGIDVDVTDLPAITMLEAYEWAKQEAAEPGLQAVFWFERTEPETPADTIPPGAPESTQLRGRLHLLQPGMGSRVYVRELVVEAEGGAEVLTESLAAIVRGLTMSLAEGEPQGVRTVELEPEEPEPPAGAATPAPAAAAPQRRGAEVSLGVAYRGGTLDSALPWQHGVGLDLDLARDRRGAVFAVGFSWLAWPALAGAVPLEIHRASVDARAGYRFRPLPKLGLDLTAGLGAERLAWDVTRASSDVQAGVPGQRWRLAATLDAGLRWWVAERLGLSLHARAGVWLVNLDIALRSTDGTQETEPLLYPHVASGDTSAGVFYTF